MARAEENAYTVPPICPQCGYNLTGLTSGRCPECGCAVIRSHVSRVSQELSAVLARFRAWRGHLLGGLWTGLAGGGLLGLALILPGAWAAFARVVIIFLGFIALGLGLSVLRIYRYPEWVRGQLSPPPDAMFGVGVAALGLADILLALLT